MPVVAPGDRWSPEIEPCSARFAGPVPLQLHGGPGARALAVAIAARADLLDETWQLAVGEACAVTGVPSSTVDPALATTIQPAEGPGVTERLAQADKA